MGVGERGVWREHMYYTLYVCIIAHKYHKYAYNNNIYIYIIYINTSKYGIMYCTLYKNCSC